MKIRKQYFFSAMEFFCCCAAAGIAELPCFAGLPEEPECTEAEAVCAMTRRGLLTAAGDRLVLCPELSEGFRAIRASRAVVSVCRRRPDLPYCLLYGTSSYLVSLRPGAREYIGMTLYRTEEIGDWLEDIQFSPGGNLPDDLLDAVSEEEREADLSREPALEAFLLRCAQEGMDGQETPPEEIIGCAECRSIPSQQLLGRLFLVRMPLYDHLVTGTAEGVRAEIYQARRMADVLCGLLKGENQNDTG